MTSLTHFSIHHPASKIVAMPHSSQSSPRPHRPVKFTPDQFTHYMGGEDPAAMHEAAFQSARAILDRGRASVDSDVTERLVEFTDVFGLETVAQMWSHSPAISLPGALWRIYALRDTVQKNAPQISLYYERGMSTDWAARVVSGVADPPTELEIITTTDEILTGAYTGEFDIALERFAAFCRVIAAGEEVTAQRAEPGTYSSATQHKHQDDATPGNRPPHAAPSAEVKAETFARAASLRERSRRLRGTAVELETAAAKWRAGTLDS